MDHIRVATDVDAKVAAAQAHQAKAKQVKAVGEAVGTVATAAILLQTVVLEALAIAVCIKVIRRG